MKAIVSSPDATRAVDAQLEHVIDAVTARLQNGEAVDMDAIAADYPEYVDQVRDLLPAVEMLVHLGAAAIEAVPLDSNGSGPAHRPPHQQLGDFRLIRPIGRGGMGMVFEAEQLSMGRRVALKVLSFIAIAQDKSLQRFRNEVRAAASLDHPNIVSIYSVGEERGVHYYAMQLIEGRSLAQVIDQLRDKSVGKRQSEAGSTVLSDAHTVDFSRPPAISNQKSEIDTQPVAALLTLPDFNSHEYYRAIARLGIQAAEALDYAHQSGVLHRDIKPANLLVDNEGKLYVTDFGLARIEADAGMTMTGDLVGTLRYMSPEQCLAKRAVVDHRSDIYSLGETLYELLTLHPAYASDDRQELLRQIAFEEPRKPRKINLRIPQDLETIILKALEKNPQDRFPTAQALADDLQRFLENRPIKAKPATYLHQLTKWSRRHMAVAWTALAASLVAATILGVSAVLIDQSRIEADEQRLVATQEKERAVDQRNAAVEERNAARLNQYYAEIVSGQADLETGNIGRLHQKLMRHLPLGDGPDHRGWEWYYLLSQCHPEERTLFHAEDAAFAAWSPDGAYVGPAGRIWRVEDGECVRAFWPTSEWSAGVAWSPDGQQFAWTTRADDSAIYIGNRQDDKVREIRGHSSSVWSVTFSPDGKRLASGSIDHTVKIWDLATGAVVRTLQAGQNVSDVAWSPDGELLAVGVCWGNGLQIWSVATGERIAERKEPDQPGVTVSWRPDGRQLAVNTSGHWYIVDRADWKNVLDHRHPSIGPDAGTDIEWNPTGTQLAVAKGEAVTIWDAARDQAMTKLVGHRASVNSVSWSPDGRKLLTADSAREIKIWDVDSPRERPPIDAGGAVQRLSWQPGSDALVAFIPSINSYSIWSAALGTKLKSVPVQMRDRGVLSPDRGYSAHGLTTDGKTSIIIEDSDSGAVHSEWTPASPCEVVDYTWSPDGTKLAIQTRSENEFSLEFWEIDSERTISRWTRRWNSGEQGLPDYRLNAVAWSPDSSKVAAAGWGDPAEDGFWGAHLHLVDVGSGKRILMRQLDDWDKQGGSNQSIAWSADGQALAYGSPQGLVETVDLNLEALTATFRPFNIRIQAITWSPDGGRLAVAAADRSIKVMERSSGYDLVTLSLPNGFATHLCWSPDGKRLAAATDKGLIYIWDATGGYDFAPDGRRRDELAWVYFQRAADAPAEKTAGLEMAFRYAPQKLDFRTLRGHTLAWLGQFDEAAREFAAAAPPQPALAYLASLRRAYALLGARDVDAFRQLRTEMFKTFGASEVLSKRLAVAWLFALTPDSVDGLEETVALMEKGVPNVNGMVEDFTACLGAMLYRLRRYDQAGSVLTDVISKLDRGGDVDDRYTIARAEYFLAMTRQRLGHERAARKYFLEATSNRVALLKDARPWTWTSHVALDTLHREAKALVDEPQVNRNDAPLTVDP